MKCLAKEAHLCASLVAMPICLSLVQSCGLLEATTTPAAFYFCHHLSDFFKPLSPPLDDIHGHVDVELIKQPHFLLPLSSSSDFFVSRSINQIKSCQSPRSLIVITSQLLDQVAASSLPLSPEASFSLSLSTMASSNSNRMNRRFYRMDSLPMSEGILDHGLSAELENKWVFEIAWEVVNKGGWWWWSTSWFANNPSSGRHLHGDSHQSTNDGGGTRKSVLHDRAL